MKIRVNGEVQVVESELTMAQFVKQLRLDESRLVVELNAKVLLKLKYSETTLVDGDVLELVEFVAGG